MYEENRLLFGHDREERLIAVEAVGPAEVELFTRAADGQLLRRREPLRPFLWAAGALPDGDGEEVETLSSDLTLGFLIRCRDWPSLLECRNRMKQAGMPHHAPGDPAHQYLIQSGKTLLKGLPLTEIRRMQIAIDPIAGPIRQVELADNHGWQATFSGEDERALLQDVSAAIIERDPDLLEGHDLYRSILRHLTARARQLKLRLRWGRDGSSPTQRSSRLQIAERTIAYPRFSIYGRHLVDTLILTHYWDVNARELESFALADVAEHFNLSGTGPEQVRALVELLGASHFIQARIFPYNFQDVLLRGNATRIDALFLREYYRSGHSIPLPPESFGFDGGYTDVFVTGLRRNVWHCDVTSLYPSIMLTFDTFPASDRLGIFRSMLSDLRAFRYDTKRALSAAETTEARYSLNALQSAFKILINSFYGYLGFGQGHFADFNAAAKVTSIGRDLLRSMVEHLQQAKAEVIEIDTDGIYFVPPPQNADALPQSLANILPDGIEVEFGTPYPAMFSYKAKNYALLTPEGEVILRGGALRSRGMEKYQRLFLEEMLALLLKGKATHIPALQATYEQAIRDRRWPISHLARVDTLQESLVQYRRKIEAGARNRSAPYELALQSGHPYEAGDQIAYYITGTKKSVTAYSAARQVEDWSADDRDENVEYYVAKLGDILKRFKDFIPKGDELDLKP